MNKESTSIISNTNVPSPTITIVSTTNNNNSVQSSSGNTSAVSTSPSHHHQYNKQKKAKGSFNNKKENNKNNTKYNNNKKQTNHNVNSNHNQQLQNDIQYNSEIELAIAMSKIEFEQQQQTNSTSVNNSNNSTDNKSLSSSSSNVSNKQNKKKNHVDISHLVQFKHERPHTHWDYRNQRSSSSSHSSSSSNYRRPSNNNTSRSSSHSNNHKPANSGSSFLQSNYLFKVNPYGNYKSSLSNPEYMVAWNKIEQVIYLSGASEFRCPICFESPVAPKVTKCGHIACFGCILRNLSHTNKCPLCLKPIEKSELKSVIIHKAVKYKENDSIEFQLLKYRENTTVPYLSAQTIPELISFPHIDDANASYSRFSILYSIDNIIEKERNEVLTAKHIAISEGEFETVRFLANAEKDIDEREIAYQKLVEQKRNEAGSSKITISSIPRRGEAGKDYFLPYQYNGNHNVKNDLEEFYSKVLNSLDWEDHSENDEESNQQEDSKDDNDDSDGDHFNNETTTTTTTTNLTKSNSNISNSENNTNNAATATSTDLTTNDLYSYANQPVEGIFYLYQCVDGQPIFIHPLCMQMLSRDAALRGNKMGEDGGFILPSLLKSKVLEIEPYEITKKSRHLYKSLNILALTTSITFVEIDLSHVVCKAVLDEFAHDLKKRRDIRNSRKRQENRKEKKKELEREHDIKRSKEIREQYDKQQEEERERKRLEKEKEDAEEAERLKNEPPGKQSLHQPKNFLDAINKYKCPEEEFKFSLSDSNKKNSRHRK